MPPDSYAQTFEPHQLGHLEVCQECGASYAPSWPESHRAVFGHAGVPAEVVRLA